MGFSSRCFLASKCDGRLDVVFIFEFESESCESVSAEGSAF